MLCKRVLHDDDVGDDDDESTCVKHNCDVHSMHGIHVCVSRSLCALKLIHKNGHIVKRPDGAVLITQFIQLRIFTQLNFQIIACVSESHIVALAKMIWWAQLGEQSTRIHFYLSSDKKAEREWRHRPNDYVQRALCSSLFFFRRRFDTQWKQVKPLQNKILSPQFSVHRYF